MIIPLFLLFVALVFFEAPGLVKKKKWRELAAFLVYWGIGMALSVPQVLGVKLPNPTRGIEMMIKPVVKLLGV